MPKPIDLAVTEQGQEAIASPAPPSSWTATPPHPRMVNRGAAGLLHKTKDLNVTPTEQVAVSDAPINRIALPLREGGLVASIEQFVSDPDNARVHPERNMEAIRHSLQLYGQTKPIVVRKANNVVVAGNGTLQAARELGWTEIAATIVEMNEVEAAGYGLADNRTAELAKWDFETVARIDRLLLEAKHPTIGWSTDELAVLREAVWVAPAVADGGFGQPGAGETAAGDSLVVGFTPDQHSAVQAAITKAREINPQISEQADCLVYVCQQWLGSVSNDEG